MSQGYRFLDSNLPLRKLKIPDKLYLCDNCEGNRICAESILVCHFLTRVRLQLIVFFQGLPALQDSLLSSICWWTHSFPLVTLKIWNSIPSDYFFCLHLFGRLWNSALSSIYSHGNLTSSEWKGRWRRDISFWSCTPDGWVSVEDKTAHWLIEVLFESSRWKLILSQIPKQRIF